MFDWLDLNHDGMMDPCEEYVSFKIREKVTGNRETAEDGELREMMSRKEQA